VENQRAVTLSFVVGGILVGVFVRSLANAVAGYAALDDRLVGGVLPVSALIGVVAGIVAFFTFLRTEKASTFVDEVWTELAKVSWPTREETTNNTTIVVGASLFFAALLAFYDFTWAKLTGIFLFNAG
jgi:preprotein translocase SecE subunit